MPIQIEIKNPMPIQLSIKKISIQILMKNNPMP